MRHDPERHHRRSIRLKDYDYRTPGLYVVTICIQNRRPLLGEIIDGEMRPTPAATMVQTTWSEIPWAYPGVEIDAFVVMPNHIHGIIYLLPGDIDFDPDSTWGAEHSGHRQAQHPAPPGNPAAGVGADPRVCPSPQNPGLDPGTMPPIGANTGPRLGQQGQTQGSAPTGNPAPTLSHGAEDEATETPRLPLPDIVKRFKSLTTHRYGVGVRSLGWEPYQGRFWQRNYYETIVRSEPDLERFRRYIEENPIRWANDRHNPDNPEIH